MKLKVLVLKQPDYLLTGNKNLRNLHISIRNIDLKQFQTAIFFTEK
jgi:hypothetical protein